MDIDKAQTRRGYLAVIATGAVGSIAGCTDSDTTETTGTPSSSGDPGTGSGGSSTDESDTPVTGTKVEPTDESETTGDADNNDGGGFVFESHELVVGQYTSHIEGILRNDTGEEQSYVEVTAKVYSDDDVRIDQFLANTTELEAGERWRFEVFVTADPENIAYYELEASTGF